MLLFNSTYVEHTWIGAGAASGYGSGSAKLMRHIAVPAPRNTLLMTRRQYSTV
jgi:hypothetical protein